MTDFNLSEYENNLETFTDGYIKTAIWSSVSDDSEEEMPITDNHNKNDIDKETLEHMEKTCRLFFEIGGYNEIMKSETDLPSDSKDKYDVAGHDFWLTQNGHGAGFWDGDWPNGEKLTELSDKFDGNNLYVGDDEKIHGENPDLDNVKKEKKLKSKSKNRP